MQQGRDAEAAVEGDRVLAQLRRDKNTTDLEFGLLAVTVARTHHGAGSFGKAHEIFDSAEAALKRAMGKTVPTSEDYRVLEWFYYGAMKNNGDALLRSGRAAEAKKKYQQVVSELSPKYGDEEENVSNALGGLADIAAEEGRLDEAAHLLTKVCANVERRQKSTTDPTLSNCLNNLGRIHGLSGRLVEAEAAFEKALALRDPSGTSTDTQIATYLINLSDLKGRRARYQEAEALLRRAINIIERNAGPNHPALAVALNSLGVQLTRQGRFADAEPFARRAREIMTTSDAKATADGLVIAANLALILANLDKWPESTALYREVVENGERDPAFRRSMYMAGTYNNLGWTYEKQADYSAAERAYAKARDLQVERLGPNHQEVALCLNNLGRAAQLQGKLKEAEKFYLDSLAIKEKTLDAGHPSLGLTYANLGDLYRSQQLWAKALPAFEKASAIAQAMDRTSATPDSQAETGATNQRLAHAAVAEAAWHVAQGAGARTATLMDTAFTAMQVSTDYSAARAMAQMSARFAKGEQAVSALVRQRQDIVGELTVLEQNTLLALSVAKMERAPEREKAMRERLTTLKSQLATLDSKLEVSFPEYVQLTRPKPVTIFELQAVLRPADAVIAYLFADNEAFAWLVTKDEKHWVRLSLFTDVIAEKSQLLRCGLDFQGSWWTDVGAEQCRKLLQINYTPAETDLLPFNARVAHELYNVLLGPFDDLIKDKQLFLVPTGPLSNLPFHVLVTERAQQEPPIPASLEDYRSLAWLWRRHALTVLPSVGSLKALRALSKSYATKPYLGFGNPLIAGPNGTDRSAWQKQNCDHAQARLAQHTAAHPPARAAALFRRGLALVDQIRRQVPLPETADELCVVSARLGGRPENVYLGARATETNLKLLSRTGVLGSSRIIHFATHGLLAGETEQMAKQLAEPALLLTPPQVADESDDGLLTASEVAQLKLNAEVVILSACNTAAGAKEGTEALSGLARAFIYAGARSLLVSHWYVNSSATVNLITGVFSAMEHEPGIGQAEGLRRAMSKLVTEGASTNAHPASWAPFVVVGESSVTK
jgi:CHAT domain-containing protein